MAFISEDQVNIELNTISATFWSPEEDGPATECMQAKSSCVSQRRTLAYWIHNDCLSAWDSTIGSFEGFASIQVQVVGVWAA